MGSAGSSAGDTSSADGAPVASDGNPIPAALDGAPAAEEAKPSSMNGSTNDAASRISAADFRAPVDANSQGNLHSSSRNPPTLRRASSIGGSVTELEIM